MADESWVAFCGIDREGMPYANIEKYNPRKHNEEMCRIQKCFFLTQEAAISNALAGLTQEKRIMLAAFDEVIGKLLALEK